MPELPEVETVRRQLAAIAGVRWESVEARPSSLFRTPAAEVTRRLTGLALEGVERRGKVLVLLFEGAEALLVHLGMSGQVLLAPPARPAPGHQHLLVALADGRRLVFRDPRRFGFIRLARRDEIAGLKELANVGADPLEPFFTWDRFAGTLRGKAGEIKPLLVGQKAFAGIGNVYADEILHQARVRPDRAASDLTPVEQKDLYHAIRSVLATAIEHGGTSFDEGYLDLFGRPGLYGARLRVYGCDGEPCHACHTPLRLARDGGRSTVYCPHCQK